MLGATSTLTLVFAAIGYIHPAQSASLDYTTISLVPSYISEL